MENLVNIFVLRKQAGRYLFGVMCVIGMCSCISRSVSNSDSFGLKGEIDGLQNGDSVFLLVMPHYKTDADGESADARIIDTLITTAREEKFIFSRSVDGVRDGYLMFKNLGPRSQMVHVFLEKGVIVVSGRLDSLDRVAVLGSPNNDLMTAHTKKEQQLYAGLRQTRDPAGNMTQNSEELQRINRENSRIREQVRQNRLDFIRNNPQSYGVPTYLRLFADNMNLDTLKFLFDRLAPGVKRSRSGSDIAEKIVARTRTQIGRPAPYFQAPDTTGVLVQLSEYAGKHVLIDFWASWCVPCRAEHPHLVEAHKQFGDQGFEILGVSLDDRRDRWVRAIKEDRLTWKNVSKLQGFGDPIATLYGVQPIPDNFLVDPDGIIIARRLRGVELLDVLKQRMLEK